MGIFPFLNVFSFSSLSIKYKKLRGYIQRVVQQTTGRYEVDNSSDGDKKENYDNSTGFELMEFYSRKTRLWNVCPMQRILQCVKMLLFKSRMWIYSKSTFSKCYHSCSEEKNGNHLYNTQTKDEQLENLGCRWVCLLSQRPFSKIVAII